MSSDGLLKALNDSQRYLDVVQKQQLGKSEAEWLIETTVSNFAKYYNSGFIEYRKSVAEAGDFAAVEWTGRGATFKDVLGREYIDCLGGQLLAHALGAPVRRHTMIELGFFQVQFTHEGDTDPLLRGLPASQLVFHWHMDVFEIPQGGVRLAFSGNTPNQAFRIGPRAYGLQYHIEVTPGMFNTWCQYPDYRQEIINVLGPDAPDLLERQRIEHYPTYRKHTRIMFENFLRIAKLT